MIGESKALPTLYLSANGDHFEYVPINERTKVNPLIGDALACRTNDEVMRILFRIKDNPDVLKQFNLVHRDTIRCAACETKAPNGLCHQESLQSMMEYVAFAPSMPKKIRSLQNFAFFMLDH